MSDRSRSIKATPVDADNYVVLTPGRRGVAMEPLNPNRGTTVAKASFIDDLNRYEYFQAVSDTDE
jgi:hypothetical protein